MKLTSDIGEFVGIFIGDGFANRYGNHYITEITGNSKIELEYYRNRIIPLVERIFGERPKLKIIGNAIRLRYNSKKIFHKFQRVFKKKWRLQSLLLRLIRF